MNCSRQRRLTTALLCTAGLLTSSCGMQPTDAPRSYKLSSSVVEELNDAGFRPREQGQLLGSLEMLFGTPQDPGYLLTTAWFDDGFNPNYPSWPDGENGSGSVTDEQFDAIIAGNQVRFADVLAAIEAEDFAGVARVLKDTPRGHILAKLWDDIYSGLPSEPTAEDITQFKDDAKYAFESYYPSLGDSAELYRLQCMHCHGNEGGADGPTARFLDPLPRDYRRGIFKYTALKDKARPRREDLLNTLTQGVYTTAMPNFRRFSDAELHGLVDYVQLLAMRGETEMLLAANMISEEALTTEMVLETYADVFERWSGQDEKLITFDGEIPAATQDLIDRGRDLFRDANRGNCFSCHGDDGRGNGIAAWRPMTDENGDPIVDENGMPKKSRWTGMPLVEPAYLDDWGHPIVPRDLSKGVFRFGRRPIDIYRRIYAGINGTPMPAIGESKDANGDPLLSDEDMWALVHYVRSLSQQGDGHGLLPQSMLDQSIAADGHGAHGEHTDHADDAEHAAPEHGEKSTH